ncbi:hypothetical protein KJ885_00480 [Patescibacteria group bacterium]|nr:hypothetical protein [Patescibacteria group bacterium]
MPSKALKLWKLYYYSQPNELAMLPGGEMIVLMHCLAKDILEVAKKLGITIKGRQRLMLARGRTSTPVEGDYEVELPEEPPEWYMDLLKGPREFWARYKQEKYYVREVLCVQ